MRITVQSILFTLASTFFMAQAGTAQDQDKMSGVGTAPNQDKMIRTNERIGDIPDQDKMVRGKIVPTPNNEGETNIPSGNAVADTETPNVSKFLDAKEFAAEIKEEGTALISVDFGEVAGSSMPFFVGDEKSIGFFGPSAKASADCGAEHPNQSCLIFQDALQIQFAVPASATSFKLQNPDGASNEKLVINLFDAQGNLVGSSLQRSGQLDNGFMGIVSTRPFQSIVISPTGAAWLLTNLKYRQDPVLH